MFEISSPANAARRVVFPALSSPTQITSYSGRGVGLGMQQIVLNSCILKTKQNWSFHCKSFLISVGFMSCLKEINMEHFGEAGQGKMRPTTTGHQRKNRGSLPNCNYSRKYTVYCRHLQANVGQCINRYDELQRNSFAVIITITQGLTWWTHWTANWFSHVMCWGTEKQRVSERGRQREREIETKTLGEK